jgi:glycosyltransferase involved in cell wall biosynthesis
MHDTLPLTHPELVFPSMSGRFAWRLKEATAARWADRIVTVSEASRKAIQAWSGWPDDRIRVITEGPDPIFRPRANEPQAGPVLERFGIPTDARFLLYVGGMSPHKNLLRLVEAFAQGAADDVLLVLAGDVNDVFHTHVPEIRATVERLHLNDRIIITGFVPDDDLVFLYSRAYALVSPSLMEGFGLPAVEAMACGTPVVSSSAGSLPEVVGDAGVYFDPTDVGSMAGVIRSFLGDRDRRDAMAHRARERAVFFTWERSARALIACFDELDYDASPNAAITRSA